MWKEATIFSNEKLHFKLSKSYLAQHLSNSTLIIQNIPNIHPQVVVVVFFYPTCWVCTIMCYHSHVQFTTTINKVAPSFCLCAIYMEDGYQI